MSTDAAADSYLCRRCWCVCDRDGTEHLGIPMTGFPGLLQTTESYVAIATCGLPPDPVLQSEADAEQQWLTELSRNARAATGTRPAAAPKRCIDVGVRQILVPLPTRAVDEKGSK